MNSKKIIVAMLLVGSTPALGAGVCICSGATPVLASGTTGQVLTRTANGTSWQALPAPAAMTWDSITGKPSTFTPTIGTTATTAAAGNHTHSGYAASNHTHVYDSAQLYGIGSACAPGENPVALLYFHVRALVDMDIDVEVFR